MIKCTVHVLFYFRILNHIHPYPSTSSINKEHHPEPRNSFGAPLLGASTCRLRKLMIRPRLRSTVSEAPRTCLFSSPSERDDPWKLKIFQAGHLFWPQMAGNFHRDWHHKAPASLRRAVVKLETWPGSIMVGNLSWILQIWNDLGMRDI
jgi:hypothetical protein